MDPSEIEQHLHQAESFDDLDRRIMDLALTASGARNGALFLWDEEENSLRIAHHIVKNLRVTIPDTLLKRDSPGIASWVFDNARPYLCHDAPSDPNYTPYLQEVTSIVAVPILYQDRPIGVISASSKRADAFSQAELARLSTLAQSAAIFVRRAQLERKSIRKTGRPYLIKGLSAEWLEVEHRIENAAPTKAPILIQGESGTGKDLVASAIHFNSKRSEEPFVTLNCAAIPDTMLESMLFGHVKGAFTGASFDKVGEFSKAEKGTLFLDEVGELPLLLQAKVLRAVEHGEVQALGSNAAPQQVDVRVICATNRNLERMANNGTFRADLFYRLSVVSMELPPLRSYKKDNLEVMAQVFIHQAAKKHDLRPPKLSTHALSVLQGYQYPGNVRELKNALEHAVIMSKGEIAAHDLPKRFQLQLGSDSSALKKPLTQTLQEAREAWMAPLERRYLRNILDSCGGNVREAAKVAGVNHVTLYRLLKKRGLALGRQVQDE